jgi:hypothetical protein
MTYSKKSRATAGVAAVAAVLVTGVASQAGAFASVPAAGTSDPVELVADFTDRTPARAAGGTVIPVTVSGGTVGSTAAQFSALRITARVGGVSAPVAWVDETHLKITTPATTKATAAPIQLSRKGTAGPESAASVAYYPGLVAVNPAKLSSLGGTVVTISGTGFLAVDPDAPDAVTFGDAAATAVTVISATKLTAVAPAGTNGLANVRVKTDGGTSEVNSASRVNFRAALSVDTTTVPTARASGGPMLVTITGGTVGASAKEFSAERITVAADRKSLPVTWVDETHLKVVMPAVAADTSHLVVTHDNIAGEPAEVSIAPVVTSLSVKSDTVAGGTRIVVRVAGANAAESNGFMFGDNAAQCAKQGSGATLAFVCTVPAATAGGPVAVTFAAGSGKASHFTAAAIFSYTDN